MEKERRTKALLLSTLVVVVATVSIAFAAMSRTLSINGIGKMDTASWSVYFDNLSEAITNGAKEEGKPNINTNDKGIIENINVKLFNPGDEISYKVDIVNDGTIDAEITMIKDIELTEVQKKVFLFKVTYTATGEVLKDGNLLPAGDRKNITINIKFRDDITEFDLPTESQTINLSYQITYTQYDGENLPVGPDSGGVTGEKAVLAQSMSVDELFEMDDPTPVPFFNGTIGRGSVESISFVNNTNVPSEAESTKWDASEAKDESIIGWYQNTDSNEYYEVYIGSNSNIYAPSDCSGLYAAFVSLKEINFNNFNTSDAVDMSYMFAMCMSLPNLDINFFDTSNVTNMSWMFTSSSITSLNLNNWDTSNVTDMSYMFGNCSSLTSIDVSNFNTNNVTNMSYMFYNCSSITSLDLSTFNTQNVTDMSFMFMGSDGEDMNIEVLNLSGWNTENVQTMEYMFGGCSKLTSLDLSSFNTENVTNMLAMFSGCTSLTSLDLSSFDTSNVTDMSYMFNNCTSLTSLDLSSFNTSNVTTMRLMFSSCTSLTTVDLRNAVFSDEMNIEFMFHIDSMSMINPQIIVKDEAQRTLLTTRYPKLTNIVLPSEL